MPSTPSLQSVLAALSLLRGGQTDLVAERLRARWSSEAIAFGLHRDLDQPFTAPDARVPITIRPLRDRDVDVLLPRPLGETADEDVMAVGVRRRMLDAHLPGCWVAAGADDEPLYMQWLFGPRQNDQVRGFFGSDFPRLRPGTALLEGAYTPPHARGRRIMPAAMARIAQKATDIGARHVVTFVDRDNIPSLKGCERAGFQPFLIRTSRFRMFRKHTTFTPFSDDGYPVPHAPAASASDTPTGS